MNRGGTIDFKIDTTAAGYDIDIYRLGNALNYLLEVQKLDGTLVLRKWYTANQAGCAGGTECSLSPVELASLLDGDYKWHMRDYGSYGYGPFTPYLAFTLSH